MKKKIEIESRPIPQGELENEIEDIREMMENRRAVMFANAIARRLKLPRVTESQLKKTEGDKGNRKGKKFISVEFDLTQEQIDKLPVGLRKRLK
jgi:hypothetical protein